MLSPERLTEVLQAKLQGEAMPELLAFWWKVNGNRQQHAQRLAALRDKLFVIPLIVRDGFESPNAVMSDLVELCTLNRASFTGVDRPPPVILVLIGLTPCSVAQVSSPVELPSWFPYFGGRTIWVSIEDLEHVADGLLNSPESDVPDLAAALHRMEVLVVSRMRRVLEIDHRQVNAFIDSIKRTGESLRAAEFLESCAKFVDDVKKPSGYRPSVRDGSSLLSRMIGLMSKLSPDEVGRSAKALMAAIQADAMTPREALPVVLYRSVNAEKEPGIRFARSVLAIAFLTSQFITASAHAAEYPSYPLALLRQFSEHLRASVGWIIDQLETVPVVPNA